MDLVSKLREMGANEAQLTSKTLEMAVRAITEDSGVIPDTVTAGIKQLADNISRATEKLTDAQRGLKNQIDNADWNRQRIETEAQRASQRYEEAKRREESIITDEDLMEAVKAYRAVLQATTDVLGNDLGADVQIAAINAGSYVAWRGIMGGKFADDGGKRRY